MKSAHLPLVVTTPYAAFLREKALALSAKVKPALENSRNDVRIDAAETAGSSKIIEGSDCVSDSSPQWVLQRQVRSALVKQYLGANGAQQSGSSSSHIHPPVALGPTNYITELLAYRSYYRNRKQARRDVKAWEKEDRRRRLELEDRRKKKAAEYHKTLMAHREDFFRFHKGRKFG